jgi:hypothetical protein
LIARGGPPPFHRLFINNSGPLINNSGEQRHRSLLFAVLVTGFALELQDFCGEGDARGC